MLINTVLLFKICDPIFGENCKADLNSIEPLRDQMFVYANFLGGFAGFVGIVIFIYGAVKLIIAGADQEKIDSARKTMIAAIIGLLIVIFARVIVWLVLSGLGV